MFCLVLTSNINGSDVMQDHIVHLLEFVNMSMGATKMILASMIADPGAEPEP